MSVAFSFQTEAKGISAPLTVQVHGSRLRILDDIQTRDNDPPEADGVYTFAKNLPVHIFTADCLPLLLFSKDPSGPIAAIHSGWRGAMKRIPEVALETLRDFSLQGVIGPCLMKCCFEVKEDFITLFQSSDPKMVTYLKKREARYYFDLPQYVIKEQLGGVEVDTSHLSCTYCSPQKLPSYRRSGGTDPRIKASIIRLG